jgi:hypothetical protein
MDRQTNRVACFPHIVETHADEGVASVIGVLQEQLALAREGKLRSVAVVTLSADGADIGTSWSCMKGDTAALVGKLTVLTHDMMSSRR